MIHLTLWYVFVIYGLYVYNWPFAFRWPCGNFHDDVIKWKHFPRYWSFVRGIHRWLVNSPLKGQSSGALMFFFDLHTGHLRRHRAHYGVTVMLVLKSEVKNVTHYFYTIPIRRHRPDIGITTSLLIENCLYLPKPREASVSDLKTWKYHRWFTRNAQCLTYFYYIN